MDIMSPGPRYKVQVFGGLLDGTQQSFHACGDDIETLESFTDLGNGVLNGDVSCPDLFRLSQHKDLALLIFLCKGKI